MNPQRRGQPAPFDRSARSYDRQFSATRLGAWLRDQVWNQLDGIFAPGDHILELGCGSGEDALRLARGGMRVHATDLSLEMLRIAEDKCRRANPPVRVEFSRLDISNPPPHFPDPTFDGAFSNFGPLNCLADLRPLSGWLAERIRPGGRAVFVLMGPICAWEIGWHLLQARPEAAFRRWQPAVLAHAGGGSYLRIWYPSPERVRQAFGAYFKHLKTAGIGVFLPPSYLSDMADRWPQLFARLQEFDLAAGPRFPFTHLGDHYLVILERR